MGKHMRTGWKLLAPALLIAVSLAAACGDESMDLDEDAAALGGERPGGEFEDAHETPIASIIDASPTPSPSPVATPRVPPTPAPSPVGTLAPFVIPRTPDRAPQ